MCPSSWPFGLGSPSTQPPWVQVSGTRCSALKEKRVKECVAVWPRQTTSSIQYPGKTSLFNLHFYLNYFHFNSLSDLILDSFSFWIITITVSSFHEEKRHCIMESLELEVKLYGFKFLLCHEYVVLVLIWLLHIYFITLSSYKMRLSD